MTVCMAIMMLIDHPPAPRDTDVTCCVFAGAAGPLLVWLFAAPLDVSTIDLLKLFLFGTTQLGLGLVFLIVGSHTRSWKFRLCGGFPNRRNSDSL